VLVVMGSLLTVLLLPTYRATPPYLPRPKVRGIQAFLIKIGTGFRGPSAAERRVGSPTSLH